MPYMANGMQYNNNTNGMGSTIPNSPPFIKNEPQEDSSRYMQQQQYNHHPDAYSMSGNSHFQHHGFDPNHFGGNDSVDPSQLTMSPSIPIQQNGGFMHDYSSSFSNNNGLNFMDNNGGTVGDDELLALGDLDDRPNGHFNQEQHVGSQQEFSTLHNLFPEMENGGKTNGVPVGSGNIDQVFSHTPENAPPAESPFIRSYNVPNQFRLQSYNGGAAETPSSYNASPIIGSDSTQGTNFDQYMSTGKRKTRPGMERSSSRKSPVAMSPHTPKTPGLGSLSLGTPDSSSLPSQPIQGAHMSAHRHHKSLSNQWDGTPGSSYLDSPLSSPGQGPSMHAQISEVFKSGKHASMPAKVEHQINTPGMQTQEAKRRRRRESHNMVERRRRDNINERIQELSHLVPQHRLEDEKVRKHLLNSGSLSPGVGGTSGSPPRATSMLAGGVGRRASGVPSTAGLTGEEKDKGPNKGDILNGAVGWTRDLMWSLHQKLEQEKTLRQVIADLGGTYPFEPNEEEKRMSSELYHAMEKNGTHNFGYSRAPGSSLRVPGYTDYAGQPVAPGSEVSSPRVSPGHPVSKNGSARGTPQQQQQTFWNQSEGIAFKEEDEYTGMDMS